MRTNAFVSCGVSIMTLALGLSLITAPALARGGVGGGGGGVLRGGGAGFHGGHGGFHGGGYGYGYGYGEGALGLGLLGGAVIGSQYPYYDSGYDNYPQDNFDPSTSCASQFRSYDPASGTYLGYDGLRHPCP